MDNKFNFTKEKLEKLPEVLGKKSKERYYDVGGRQSQKYLIARKDRSGQIKFGIYIKFNGKPIEYDLSTIPYPDTTIDQARKLARKDVAKFAEGIDPREERKRLIEQEKSRIENLLTFKKVGDKYLDYLDTNWQGEGVNHSFINARSTFKNHVYPVFGNTEISELTISDVEELKKISTKAVYNKIVTFMKAAINREVKEENNPLYFLKKFSMPSRTKVIQKSELKDFWKSVNLEEQIYQDFVRVVMFTGARKYNVLSMKWSDIDLDSKLWTLKVKGSNGGKDHSINLSNQILDILKRRYKTKTSNYVFPSKTSKTGHISEKSSKGSFWRRIIVRADLYSEDRKLNLTIHDLRRSLATFLINEKNVGLEVIKEILGHSDISVTEKTYAHLKNEKVAKAQQVASDIFESYDMKINTKKR